VFGKSIADARIKTYAGIKKVEVFYAAQGGEGCKRRGIFHKYNRYLQLSPIQHIINPAIK
jgi:hypothetical protein